MKPTLKFLALSGTTGVTQNLYVYEYGDDMIIVDCGVGFPESDMYGVDLVLPDFSYVVKNASKLRAVFVSHGHEDHLGALPFLYEKVKFPIYATKLVAGFIKDKFEDYDLKVPEIKVLDPERDVASVGAFKVTPFRVSHSVPDGVGFCIDTPEGKCFHVPDYKFDWTPQDGRPFDVDRAVSLAQGGVLVLASDSLGSTTPGYTESELEIEGKIENIVRNQKGRIYFTTISSNISRMQQAINVAGRLGRKVVFIGRSIESKTETAKELGYLFYQNNLVITPKQAEKLRTNEVMYIISGSYGQAGSALYRAAMGEHQFLRIDQNDTVIFSGDPAPPGSKAAVDFVVDKLFERGVNVHYYDMQEDLHVSGHGSMKDIEMLFALVRPKYFIPIGGTVRFNKAYSQIAQRMGAKKEEVLELGAGDVVEYSNFVARRAGNIPVKEVLVDGVGVGDVGSIVLRDRKVLATEGAVVVIVQFDRGTKKVSGNPEIISRGFVYEGKSKDLLSKSSQELSRSLNSKKDLNERIIKDETVNFLESYFYKLTARRPMILPVVIEV